MWEVVPSPCDAWYSMDLFGIYLWTFSLFSLLNGAQTCKRAFRPFWYFCPLFYSSFQELGAFPCLSSLWSSPIFLILVVASWECDHYLQRFSLLQKSIKSSDKYRFPFKMPARRLSQPKIGPPEVVIYLHFHNWSKWLSGHNLLLPLASHTNVPICRMTDIYVLLTTLQNIYDIYILIIHFKLKVKYAFNLFGRWLHN